MAFAAAKAGIRQHPIFVSSGFVALAVFVTVAVLHYQAQRDAAGLHAQAVVQELEGKLERGKQALVLFASIARDRSRSLADLREQAKIIGTGLDGWFTIASPGALLEVDFTSFGDGSVPPTLPRVPNYGALGIAEKMAFVTGKPSLSDVFIGPKSRVPTVALVIETEFLGTTHFAYLSVPVASLVDSQVGQQTGAFETHVFDRLGHDTDALLGRHADNVDRAARWFAPKITETRRVFGSWTIKVSVSPFGPDAVLYMVLVALAAGALTHVLAVQMLKETMRQASTPSSVSGGDGGPSQVDDLLSVKEKLGFVLMLGHELRSPLISLLSAIDLVKRNPGLYSQSYLDHATQEAHALLRLVDDVLACAKISGGTVTLNRELYDPFDLAETCVQTVKSLGQHGPAPIQIELGPGMPVGTIIGDRAKIRQILINLLSNAVRYATGSAITLRIDAEAVKDDFVRMRYTVVDKGPGLSAEQQANLFKTVGVTSDEVTAKPSSNGLGLVTSRLLAEAMGGTLGAQSAVGKGSSFWIDVVQEKAASLPMTDPSDAGPLLLTGLDVLVAEDDAIVRHLIRDDLATAGASVTAVSSGEELLEELAKKPFDAVLTDIRMDGMTGYEVARVIHLQAGKRPVLAGISAHYGMSEEIDPSGLFDFVMDKPFSIKAFTRKLLAKLADEQKEGSFDDDQIRKIISAYGEDAPQLLQSVVEDFRRGLEICESADFDKAGRLYHRMAGSASTIGARLFSRALRDAETACELKDGPASKLLYGKAWAEFENVERYLGSIRIENVRTKESSS